MKHWILIVLLLLTIPTMVSGEAAKEGAPEEEFWCSGVDDTPIAATDRSPGTDPYHEDILAIFLQQDAPTVDTSSMVAMIDDRLLEPIIRSSYGLYSADLDIAGPFIEPLVGQPCGTPADELKTLWTAAINRAYNAGFTNLDQYEKFLLYRHNDYDVCHVFTRNHAFGPPDIPYPGGSLTGRGATFAPKDISQATYQLWPLLGVEAHELAHTLNWPDGRSFHIHKLWAASDPADPASSRVPYFYDLDESSWNPHTGYRSAGPYTNHFNPYVWGTASADSPIDLLGSAGSPQTDNFTAYQKLDFGWIKPKQVYKTVPGTRPVVDLLPTDLDNPPSGAGYAMATWQIPGSSATFVLEYRRNADTGPGVYVYILRYALDFEAECISACWQNQTSYILFTDMNEPDSIKPLQVGQPVELDWMNRVSVTVLSQTPERVMLEIDAAKR